MQWFEILLKILGLVLTPICSFLIGYITTKRKSAKQQKETDEKEYQAIKETCKLSLRLSLQNDYIYYKEQGYCSIDDKDEVEIEYSLYHDIFKGNGRGTRYYEAIMALPDEPNKKQ